MHYVTNAVGATAIESTSTEPETTVLLEPDNLYMPTVYYTEEVWATIRYLVDKCPVRLVGLVLLTMTVLIISLLKSLCQSKKYLVLKQILQLKQ